jgi:hypothetical protein
VNFSDGSWASGPARLGYGNDGEATVVSFGPDSGAKYATTYFRKSFVVPPGYVYTNLQFKLARDDGAVVYLNGRELYRDNMPPGPVTYLTFASGGASDEQTFYPTNIPVNNLPAGTNVVAVEIHQSSGSSGDIGFNLELSGSGGSNNASRPAATVAMVSGQVEISWPAAYTTWRAYGSSEVQAPMAFWAPLSTLPVVSGTRIVLRLPPGDPTGFFRLGTP